MSEAVSTGLGLFASDAFGQRKYAINFSRAGKVGDLIKALVPQMGLSSNDANGRPVEYQAFSKRDSCHLRGSETVGEALREGDEVSLLPDIQAG